MQPGCRTTTPFAFEPHAGELVTQVRPHFWSTCAPIISQAHDCAKGSQRMPSFDVASSTAQQLKCSLSQTNAKGPTTRFPEAGNALDFCQLSSLKMQLES
jgi:hypothetical protein